MSAGPIYNHGVGDRVFAIIEAAGRPLSFQEISDALLDKVDKKSCSKTISNLLSKSCRIIRARMQDGSGENGFVVNPDGKALEPRRAARAAAAPKQATTAPMDAQNAGVDAPPAAVDASTEDDDATIDMSDALLRGLKRQRSADLDLSEQLLKFVTVSEQPILASKIKEVFGREFEIETIVANLHALVKARRLHRFAIGPEKHWGYSTSEVGIVPVTPVVAAVEKRHSLPPISSGFDLPNSAQRELMRIAESAEVISSKRAEYTPPPRDGDIDQRIDAVAVDLDELLGEAINSRQDHELIKALHNAQTAANFARLLISKATAPA